MMEQATQGRSIPGRTGDQRAANNGGGVLMAMWCFWDGHAMP